MNDLRIPMDEIISLVREAGARVLEFFNTSVEVRHKGDHSPVTEADLASNTILVDGLKRYGLPIISEEMPLPDETGSDYHWIIDPLDGTRSFIKGRDDFSVMVGLSRGGEPVLGVVYQPYGDILYHAQKGAGAFTVRNGIETKIGVSKTASMEDAILSVSRRAQNEEPFKSLVARLHPKEVRYVSSNGVKMCRIAEGEYDLFFNPSDSLGQWDYCAPQAILEEAGGTVSYLDVSPVRYGPLWNTGKKSGIAATNGLLHKSLCEAVG